MAAVSTCPVPEPLEVDNRESAWCAGRVLMLVNNDAAWTCLRESILHRIGAKLSKAVTWMHGVGIVHRDIKLENILLATQVFTTLERAPISANVPTLLMKLTDFGLSRFVDIRMAEERTRDGDACAEGDVDEGPLLSMQCSSEAYTAPELVRDTTACCCPSR